MKMNKPNLYIIWRENDKEVKLGPFFNMHCDGIDIFGFKWIAYEVQDKNYQFRRITVPLHATIESIIYT